MSTQVNARPESSLGAPPIPPAAPRPMYWSVRRELWENRSLWVVPLIAAAVVLLGFSIRALGLPHRMRTLSELDPARQQDALVMPYSLAAALIILTTYVVGAFYCLDALHGERRDRSILFWKSLPVSDRTTVLSKAGIPLVVLPLIAFTVSLITQATMLLWSSAVLLLSGVGAVELWARLPLLQMSVVMLYGLTVHALWHAPIYGWLLLVSGWARRATFLWAVLPWLAIGLLERMAFHTSHLASLLKHRLSGSMAVAFAYDGQEDITRLAQLDPARFLSSPGLWIGLLAAAVFLAAAVRLRRLREPI